MISQNTVFYHHFYERLVYCVVHKLIIFYFPIQEAILTMDQKVCEAKKRLNAARAQSRKQEQRLAECETQLKQMRKDASDADNMDAGTSDEAMVSQDILEPIFLQFYCFFVKIYTLFRKCLPFQEFKR